MKFYKYKSIYLQNNLKKKKKIHLLFIHICYLDDEIDVVQNPILPTETHFPPFSLPKRIDNPPQ